MGWNNIGCLTLSFNLQVWRRKSRDDTGKHSSVRSTKEDIVCKTAFTRGDIVRSVRQPCDTCGGARVSRYPRLPQSHRVGNPACATGHQLLHWRTKQTLPPCPLQPQQNTCPTSTVLPVELCKMTNKCLLLVFKNIVYLYQIPYY